MKKEDPAKDVLSDNGTISAKTLYDLLSAGFDFADREMHEQAIKSFDKVLKINPHDLNANLHKGHSFFELGMYEKTIQCYDNVSDKIPNMSDVNFRKGYSFNALGMHEKAIQCYERCLELRSHRYHHVYGHRALIY